MGRTSDPLPKRCVKALDMPSRAVTMFTEAGFAVVGVGEATVFEFGKYSSNENADVSLVHPNLVDLHVLRVVLRRGDEASIS